jgi:hypothetical protein
MKQPTLLRWIESAERARFCLLADEGHSRAITDATSPPPFNLLLATLREQLCSAETAARRLSPFRRMPPAD